MDIQVDTSPGSYTAFKEAHPEIADDQLMDSFHRVLTTHRYALADAMGVSLGDLHDMKFNQMIDEENIDG